MTVFYKDPPLSDSESPCLGCQTHVRTYLCLNNQKVKVGITFRLISEGVRCEVRGCEGVSRVNICGVITHGAGVTMGPGDQSLGVRIGICLFRIVTPELTHRLCEEIRLSSVNY